MVVIHSEEKLVPVRIRYGTESAQFGDLYQTSKINNKKDLYPLVILIHGGYWKDNHNLDSYATSQLIPELVSLGCSVWNIEYRRMDSVGQNIKAPWPSVFHDVASAVDEVRNFADEYFLDRKRISVIGHSAGGCLALWAASRRKVPATSPLFTARPLVIQNAISIGGVLNLTHPEDLCQPMQIIRLMGGSALAYPERYLACNPTELYDPSVQTLVIHGAKDKTVSVHQALSYLENAPESTKLEIWPDTDHFSMLPHHGKWNQCEWLRLKNRIKNFFNLEYA